MMQESYSWIEAIIGDLPRPEYAKQPEALLTDLLWRSAGSNLSEFYDSLSNVKLSKGKEIRRLIPRRIRKTMAEEKSIETLPIALGVDLSGLIQDTDSIPETTKSLLESILAPKSKGDVFHACVPIHPDIAGLQTLHGIVNKTSPPNLAKAIEIVGWLGGSNIKGDVARIFIQCYMDQGKSDYGLAGITDSIVPKIANHVWSEFGTVSPNIKWPGVKPLPANFATESKSLLSKFNSRTPFSWFWTKWKTLCDPNNGWFDSLPARRFVDWATCLLRTGLSFAYLWEAEFYVKLYFAIVEGKNNRERGEQKTEAMDSVRAMLNNAVILASIEPLSVPASQKHAWNSISSLLSKGEVIRSRIARANPIFVKIEDYEAKEVMDIVEDWIISLDPSSLDTLAQPVLIESKTAKNTREFVRYLLQPRSSDDDKQDQADFYFLAKTNSKKSFWFNPGPEWLVVVTSLLCLKPNGECTLGQLLEDLRKLGIRVDREVLVSLLETSGLSTDSPDADNALIIRAGF